MGETEKMRIEANQISSNIYLPNFNFTLFMVSLNFLIEMIFRETQRGGVGTTYFVSALGCDLHYGAVSAMKKILQCTCNEISTSDTSQSLRYIYGWYLQHSV